ncbi:MULTISPECIES: murein hydrolase activator EnvC family protein [unclassified Microbacterium]|uniref:murein hydrolase activator EnvC family protein n=1 Tax=unclassified Microbacterium TaxID=2609290 RepID=UPI0030168F8E
MRTPSRSILSTVLALALIVTALSPASASETSALPRWRWPLSGPHAVLAPYRAPAHAYGAGHRGIDLGTSLGAAVTAPADGVVAFRGTVVDRPLVTIEHPGGLTSTFEPVESSLIPGEAVIAGQEIGSVDVGGHTAAGGLHVGVRREGDYINPMLLFGDVPRAVLLPCCE